MKSHSMDGLCCYIKEWFYDGEVDASESDFGLRRKRETH